MRSATNETAWTSELLPHSSDSPDRSLEFDRTRWCLWEKVWAEEWAKENRDSSILYLLVKDHRNGNQLQPSLFKMPLSVRERRIVATVVQWMGTNVGSGFVTRVQNRIEELRKDPDRCTRCGEISNGSDEYTMFNFRCVQFGESITVEPADQIEQIASLEALSRGRVVPCVHRVSACSLGHKTTQPRMAHARAIVARCHLAEVKRGTAPCKKGDAPMISAKALMQYVPGAKVRHVEIPVVGEVVSVAAGLSMRNSNRPPSLDHFNAVITVDWYGYGVTQELIERVRLIEADDTRRSE